MRLKVTAALVVAIAFSVGACGGSSGSEPTQPTGPVRAGDPVAGATIYRSACATCHRADLQGIDGLGSALVPNEFVASMTEEELAAFLLVGRAADDPDNMQGIAMPPKGGNDSLTSQDLRDVAAYLKAQQ